MSAEILNTLNENVTILPGENEEDRYNYTYIRLRVRRKTSSQWTSYLEVIPQGEPCFAIDTGELRIGDGINTWNTLPGSSAGINPSLFRRETVQENGVSKQYIRVLLDDGELT